MDVLVTKILSHLLYPSGMVFLLALTALVLLVLRKRRSAALAACLAFALFTVCASPLVATRLISSLETQYPPQPLENVAPADAIILLGGALDLPQPPRHYPRLGRGADRLLHTARLYKANKAPRVIVTGGNVFEQKGVHAESWYIARLLAEWGVPESAIVTEARSRNTYENAEYTRPILESLDARRVLLVTSGLHMPRALAVFRRALAESDVDIVPVAADIAVARSNNPAVFAWMPSADAFAGSTRAIHEYLGHWMYRLRDWI